MRVSPPFGWAGKSFPFIHHVRARIRTGHVIEPVYSSVGIRESVLRRDIIFAVLFKLRVPRVFAAAGIYEQSIVELIPTFSVRSRTSPLPDDLIEELVLAEDLIQHLLHVMRSVIIAMVVEAPSFLEDAA